MPSSAGFDLFLSHASQDVVLVIAGRPVQTIAIFKRELESHRHPDDRARSFRVCTYQDDFPLDRDVRDAIKTSIAGCRWLLVACSEAASRSEYVRFEIDTHLALHGENRIVPALLTLQPTQAFPSLFASRHVQAVDLSNESDSLGRSWRQRARAEAHKLVARVWELPFERVFDRFEADRKRRLKRIVGSVAVALVAVLAAIGWGVLQQMRRDDAERAREIVQAVERGGRAAVLAASAGREREALELGIEAVTVAGRPKWDPPSTAFAGLAAALNAATRSMSLQPPSVENGGAPVTRIAVCANGRRAITASRHAHVWNVEDGTLHVTLLHPAVVEDVEFCRDGARALTACRDGVVRIWTVDAGTLVSELPANAEKGPIWDADFSPDGSVVVAGGEDWLARVWRIRDAALMATLSGHVAPIREVAFSPDGTRIVTASDDASARI